MRRHGCARLRHPSGARLALAEIARVLGDTARAARLADRGARALAPGNPTIAWEAVRAQRHELIRCRRFGVTHLWCRVRVMTVTLNEPAYKFPYGDFENIHRCGVLAAEARAGQRKYHDIETAAAHLHGSLGALRPPTHH